MFYGVAYYGNANRQDNPKLCDLWLNIIRRCYYDKLPTYQYYGALGVTVCDRWRCFDYFLEDIQKVEGYDFEKISNGELVLDKDIKQSHLDKSQRVYSLETCMFVTKNENLQNRQYKKANKFIAESPDGETIIGENLTKFCKERKIHQGHAYGVLKGKLKHTKGWKFYEQVD